MTYMLLIYTSRTPGDPLPAALEKHVLDEHRSLQTESIERGELHAVVRLKPTAEAKTLRFDGRSHDVTDGPYMETKEWLVGAYVIDCVDERTAIERAKRICPLEDHAIEIRPVSWRRAD